MTELREAGYDPERVERKPAQPPVLLDDLAVQEIASQALDRCAAGASTWTPHTVQEHVTRIATEAGVRAAPAQLREFIALASDLATSDCFSILPPGTATPEHVAHLTSVEETVAAETALERPGSPPQPRAGSRNPPTLKQLERRVSTPGRRSLPLPSPRPIPW